MWAKIRQTYFGPWPFNKHVLLVAIPFALQQLLVSCMGIIDSIMVAWIGEVSAVGTAAQIETLCSSVAFGAISGTGIYAAQYYGAKKHLQLKQTFGLSIALAIGNGLVWLLTAQLGGQTIMNFYLSDPAVVQSGWSYLRVVCFSYIFNSIAFCFSYLFRCMQKPKVPLVIGIVAMITNCFFNYVLIFGVGPFPQLGVVGAACGTVIAQVVSVMAYVVYSIYTHQPFIGKFSEMFGFTIDFCKPIFRRIYPLIFNELMFGLGTTLFVKAFGALGTQSMDAYYVGAKIYDLFNAAVVGVSSATAAILGAALGANEIEKAKTEADYFIGLALLMAIGTTVFIVVTSPLLVACFGLTDPLVHTLATQIVSVFAIKIALRLFIVIVFSALRAGGDSKVLTVLDSGIMWVVGLPSAFIAVWCGLTNIAVVFLVTQIEQIVRVFVGMKRFNSKKWVVNLTTGA